MATDIILRGNSQGSGVFTFQAPSSSGTQILTLPDVNADLLTGNSALQSSNITGTLAAANAATGSIIQVIQETSTSYSRIGGFGSTLVEPGVNITPQFSDSKIWVTHSAGAMGEDTKSVGFALERNGSRVWTATRYGYTNDGNWSPINWSCSYIDSPNTTSSVNYRFRIHSEGGDLRHNDDDPGTPGMNNERIAITTAMEIR